MYSQKKAKKTNRNTTKNYYDDYGVGLFVVDSNAEQITSPIEWDKSETSITDLSDDVVVDNPLFAVVDVSSDAVDLIDSVDNCDDAVVDIPSCGVDDGNTVDEECILSNVTSIKNSLRQ